MASASYSLIVPRPEKPAKGPIGQWVRDIRKKADLTQAEFGARLRPEPHVHPTTVTRWERGEIGIGRLSRALIRKAFPGAPRPPDEDMSEENGAGTASDYPIDSEGPGEESAVMLSKFEHALIENFRRMTPDDQAELYTETKKRARISQHPAARPKA